MPTAAARPGDGRRRDGGSKAERWREDNLDEFTAWQWVTVHAEQAPVP